MIIRDLGLIPYRRAWEMQHCLMSARQEGGEDTLLLVEHPSVFTLGFHGNASNMLMPESFLQSKGIECIRIERGGDITYHGPGQLVVYPILNLRDLGLGVKAYVNLLEETVIRTLADFGIESWRNPGAPGVWMGIGTARERKICALGVKCSHFVTMHGLALNVNTDLTPFGYINPCGFQDKGVTSMALELGEQVDIEEVKKILTGHFVALLSRPANEV